MRDLVVEIEEEGMKELEERVNDMVVDIKADIEEDINEDLAEDQYSQHSHIQQYQQ